MYKGLIRRCKIMIAASIIFIVFIGLSMTVYPGGNLVDRSSVHYNFFLNYFSDLGQTFTHSGKQNTASDVLFIIAMGIAGLVLVYFSRIWRGLDIEVHERIVLGFISKVLLVVCGFSFIGMAFSPWNLYLENHILFFKTAVACMFGWTLIISVLQARNEKLKVQLVLNVIFLLLVGVYDYLLFTDNSFGTERNLEFNAVAQKVIMLLFMVNIMFQSIGINQFLRRADFRRSGKKNFYI
jgi:hypothetical protein